MQDLLWRFSCVYILRLEFYGIEEDWWFITDVAEVWLKGGILIEKDLYKANCLPFVQQFSSSSDRK